LGCLKRASRRLHLSSSRHVEGHEQYERSDQNEIQELGDEETAYGYSNVAASIRNQNQAYNQKNNANHGKNVKGHFAEGLGTVFDAAGASLHAPACNQERCKRIVKNLDERRDDRKHNHEIHGRFYSFVFEALVKFVLIFS
jgi:hypothetical protein